MTKFSKIFKKPFFAHFGPIFPIFWVKKNFLENPALSHTTSFGFLAPCQNLEKVRTDRRKDGPYFIGPFRLPPGVQLMKKRKRNITMDI